VTLVSARQASAGAGAVPAVLDAMNPLNVTEAYWIPRVEVEVDGVRLRHCLFADTEHGVAIGLAFDGDGHVLTDHETLRTRLYRGDVRFVKVEDDALPEKGR
jgi:hypothetical protein